MESSATKMTSREGKPSSVRIQLLCQAFPRSRLSWADNLKIQTFNCWFKCQLYSCSHLFSTKTLWYFRRSFRFIQVFFYRLRLQLFATCRKRSKSSKSWMKSTTKRLLCTEAQEEIQLQSPSEILLLVILLILTREIEFQPTASLSRKTTLWWTRAFTIKT